MLLTNNSSVIRSVMKMLFHESYAVKCWHHCNCEAPYAPPLPIASVFPYLRDDYYPGSVCGTCMLATPMRASAMP